MPRSRRLNAALLAGLVLLGPWPLLAAGRSKAAPRPAPEEPSIFAPAVPPETPRPPAGPSPEVCAKVREARRRLEHYNQQSGTQSELRRLAAEKELAYTRMGYRPAYDRLRDDLIGKVETPWPACEAPQ